MAHGPHVHEELNCNPRFLLNYCLPTLPPSFQLQQQLKEQGSVVQRDEGEFGTMGMHDAVREGKGCGCSACCGV